jgi:hypothetical protein
MKSKSRGVDINTKYFEAFEVGETPMPKHARGHPYYIFFGVVFF